MRRRLPSLRVPLHTPMRVQLLSVRKYRFEYWSAPAASDLLAELDADRGPDLWEAPLMKLSRHAHTVRVRADSDDVRATP